MGYPKGYIAWSFSRLSDFEMCPLLFLHKYIKKTIPFVANEAMERGKRDHKELERNTIRAIHGEPAVPGNVGHVQPIIEKFVRSHMDVRIEEQLAFDHGANPCSWFGKDVWFRAVVDMVGMTNVMSKLQDHTASIIDWKTGQFRPKPDQLKIYNMAAMLKWPLVRKVTSALVFIDHKKSSPPLMTERHEMHYLIQEFSDRGEAIQIANEKDNWPAKKCWQCRFCGVTDCKYITR